MKVTDLATLPVTTFYVNERDPRRAAELENARQTKTRQQKNVAAGRCLNENLKGTHGPATHGLLCKSCRDRHNKTKAAKVRSERPFSRVIGFR